MRMFAAALALSVFVIAAPVSGRQSYAAYEGVDGIKVGSGGTRIVRDGVDFWTTGDPPRRYQVLGVLRDSRYIGMITPDPVGAKSIAAKIKGWGGDAAIIIQQDDRSAGTFMTGQGTAVGHGFSATGVGFGFDKTTTQMLIVKYMPPD